jgi:hypothetical protein
MRITAILMRRERFSRRVSKMAARADWFPAFGTHRAMLLREDVDVDLPPPHVSSS